MRVVEVVDVCRETSGKRCEVGIDAFTAPGDRRCRRTTQHARGGDDRLDAGMARSADRQAEHIDQRTSCLVRERLRQRPACERNDPGRERTGDTGLRIRFRSTAHTASSFHRSS